MIDVCSMQPIHSSPWRPEHVFWAAQSVSSHHQPRLSAFFFRHQIADFSFADSGIWKVDAFRPVQNERPHYSWHTFASGGHCYFGRRCVQGKLEFVYPYSDNSTTGMKQSNGCHYMQWAPFPSCWPRLFAHVLPPPYRPISLPTDKWCVRLIDSLTEAVLGTWTKDALSSILRRRRLRGDKTAMHSVKWAPNGRHLAVFSGSCTMVLTFG